MALIELTADDLCAIASFPFPCEEGKIIDPQGLAHFIGLVEVTATQFGDAVGAPKPASGEAVGDPPEGRASTADPRLVMLSLASSMEASQAVARARPVGPDVSQDGAERVSVRESLDAFVDGVIASPPVLTTVIPPAGSVIVIGTVVFTIPNPPPVPPRWDEGEQIGRNDLLALAARFQSASKMYGIDATAGDLAGAAARLFDAAVAR